MSQAPDTRGKRNFILVVEDSSAQAAFLCALLGNAGIEVKRAANGAEALEFLAVRRPELIISDVVMPVMDGYEFCRRAKAAEAFRDVPFMLLTALSEPQDIFKGLESGADFYSIKPYDGDALLGRVRDILDASGAQYTHKDVSNARAGIDVVYAGHKYAIHAGRSQILDLLLATFENIVHKNAELRELNQRLTETLEANKTLRGLIPICGYCKKIRDDRGYWDQVESFVSKHTEARFSHGICPECLEKAMLEAAQTKASRRIEAA